MKPVTRWISLSLLLVAALSAYAYGSATSAVAFIILGMLLEGTFWIGLLGKNVIRVRYHIIPKYEFVRI